MGVEVYQTLIILLIMASARPDNGRPKEDVGIIKGLKKVIDIIRKEVIGRE
jgi:hypothetical protein